MSLYKLTPLEVGEKIKSIRLNKGLTMREFANLIDEKSTISTVNNWEHGKNYPNKKRLLKIAKLGNISIQFLTNGEKIFSDLTTVEQQKLMSDKKDYEKEKHQFTKGQLLYFLEETDDFSRPFNLYSRDFLYQAMHFSNVTEPEKNDDPVQIRFLSYIIHALEEYYLKRGEFKDSEKVRMNLKSMIDFLIDNPNK